MLQTSRFRVFALLTLLGALIIPSSRAQTAVDGAVGGTVVDASNAIVGGATRRLTHQNDSWLAEVQLGATEEFASKSSDGTDVHGLIAPTVGLIAAGGFVVDTPGLRQFELWGTVPGELAAHFIEAN